MDDYKNGNAKGHKYTNVELWRMKYSINLSPFYDNNFI